MNGQDLLLNHQDKLESIDLLKELLAIPNDAHYPEEIEKNIIWCEKAFTERTFTTRRVPSAGIPLLLAEYQIHTKMFLLYSSISK